ncbi:MAG TPA: aspartyl-phosphate phosphatase Spo0E family protein [Bacillota bacterium]|nr:aspartyl-phosphate phosphatase Spo0E family protein [Bacillota bacterium]
MNKLEYGRINLDEEIEQLRHRLNKQKNIASKETMKLSLELDRLILMAMQEKGYGKGRRQVVNERIQEPASENLELIGEE